MLREMLRAEIERRWVALLFLAGLFAAPPTLFAIRLHGVRAGWFALAYEETDIFATVLCWTLLFACAVWGFDTWSPDRRAGWVYALALPVKRLRWFFVRYVAGLVCVGGALLGLLAASFLAAAIVSPPAGFYAYPGPYSAWIALSGLMLYTLGFVVGAGSSRRAAVLITLLGVMVAGLAVTAQWAGRTGEHFPLVEATPLRLLTESPRLFDY
jgi:hypothetical protein